MKLVVFLGPTLSRAAARAVLDATFLPPAAQGDLYRVAREAPFAIGLIDGYFDRLPAVWHKEVLWAMAQGIHVFGASSMGALRAAELHNYGMRGVGRIYEAFRFGDLEDDDEVTIVHGDESRKYEAMTEAMVNIRATLGRAASAGVIGEETSNDLLVIAKRFFYPDRTYAGLLASAAEAGVPSREIARLRDFLLVGRVDQKREDALELLLAMKALRAAGQAAPPVHYSLARTDRWERLVEWAESQPPLGAEGG